MTRSKNGFDRDEVKTRDAQLQQGFDLWLAEHEGSNRKYFGLPYYNAAFAVPFVADRYFVGMRVPAILFAGANIRLESRPDSNGILIYTGSPDAEGTLGGLVEAGKRIRTHMSRGLELGRLCSKRSGFAPFMLPLSTITSRCSAAPCHGCL